MSVRKFGDELEDVGATVAKFTCRGCGRRFRRLVQAGSERGMRFCDTCRYARAKIQRASEPYRVHR